MSNVGIPDHGFTSMLWSTCYDFFLCFVFFSFCGWFQADWSRWSFCQSWDLGRMAPLPAEGSWQTTSCPHKAKQPSGGDGVLTLCHFCKQFCSACHLLALTKLLVIIDIFIQNKILLLYRFLSFLTIYRSAKSQPSLYTFPHAQLQHNQPPRVCTHTLQFWLRKLWVFGLSTKSPLIYWLCSLFITRPDIQGSQKIFKQYFNIWNGYSRK